MAPSLNGCLNIASTLTRVVVPGLAEAAAGVEANLVYVPRETAKALRPPILHWAEWYRGGTVFSIEKAKRELSWQPSFGLAAGLANSHRWFEEEGHEWYPADFSRDDELLRSLQAS